ncbi:isopeptide-forming domain-containing fimbrial protein, partial [Siminovitchia terrae]|uniref:isopeptide-forming domain-containing fimbrial protein n=1 Tax=Siminovitchia terrae TaxID=1914933 RepID=UPI0028ACC3E2
MSLAISKRLKAGFKKSIIFFAMILVTLNGMLPSFSNPVQAAEIETTEAIEQPNVSKDIDGEESKEIPKGEDYNYNVSVDLPESVSGYESIEILDDLDKYLAVQGTAVLIDEVENDTYTVVVDGQKVSLELAKEELEELAGKEVKLQITTQVKEDAATADKIENVAQIVINDDLVMETNPAVVMPIEMVKEKPDSEAKQQSESQEESESQEKSESVDDVAKAKETDSEASTEKTNTKSKASVTNTETGFNFNITDTYISVTSYNGKPGTWLLQIDGHNPSAGVKAEIHLPSVAGFDSIAMSKDGTEIYGIEPNNNTFFYKVTEDGNATKQNITMPSELATLTPQGGGAIDPITGHYGLFVRDVNKQSSRIILIDPQTGNVTDSSISPNNRINLRDVIFDDKGNIYYIDATNEEWVRYDRATGTETVFGRVGNIPLTTPGFGAGLSYLPSNELLIVFTRGDVFASDPKDNVAKHLVTIPNMNFVSDAASAVFPNFYTELNVAKFANGSKETNSVNNNDVIEYKLVVNNTGNLPADNVILTDKIPAGTEYVANSMKLNGKTVADIDGQSPLVKGLKIKSPAENASEGVILVDEENAATITFQVKVKDDTAPGSEILNQASMTSSEPDEVKSNEVISKIEESIDPPDACAAPVALINGSFEEPPFSPNDSRLTKHIGWFDAPQGAVPGWKTTDRSGLFEIMNKSLGDEIPPGHPYAALKVTPAHGQQFAELNSREAAQLYQDVDTTPGQTIYWRLAHKGRDGQDTMALKIDSATVDPKNLKTIQTMTSGKEAWKYYSGSYVVPAGQTKTRFGFEAVSSATGSNAAGNFLDDIFLGTEPCVTAEKTVSPEGDVFAGDELTYEMTVKNSGGDIAANTVIEDAIPEGTEYVPGSMKILNGPKAGDLTDVEDNDAGHFNGEKVIFKLEDLPNTTTLPDGITVQFKVKALSDHAGKDVINKAQVKYKNLLTGKDEEKETNETKTPIKYKDPALKSEKSATIKEKGEGNTDKDNPEVGDTLLYTIKTQNTNKDSLVKNLVISDEIPEGLDYVAGSLKVDDESVTDAKDDDNGHAVDGKISGQFGDIKGTDWHTLTFEVKVKAGQAGMDIKNIATVKGDNIDKPDEPEEEVQIYPREPKLESEKSATNAEKGKEKFEVGDTIVYTIKTRNKVSDSLVSNLTIEDTLPAGLELIADSLKASHGGTVEENNGVITAKFGEVTDTEWRTVTFEAKIKSGQSGKDIKNTAKVTVDEIEEPEEPTTTVKVDPKDPKLQSEKSGKLEAKADGNTDKDNPEVGDTLLYTIKTKNTIEDSLVKNLVISDKIPEGLEYVAGSLQVDGVSVTDAKDDDNGHAIDGELSGQFGDIEDTEWHTLEFLVKVKEGQAGEDIKNIAAVKGENIDKPDEPEEEVKIYPREPKLESEKSATNAEKGKEKFEVGDTIVYTIKTRNKVS